MKKISLLIGLLVIVFAATAYAQPIEFKMSGFMDFVAATFRNIPSDNQPVASGGLSGLEPDPTSGNSDHAGALANSRARLKFQAIAGKELSATIFFEMDSATWGDGGDGRNNMGRWNADRAAVEVKNAFFDVAIPYFGIPTPMTLRLGIQSFAIRDSWFFYADGAGLKLVTKADPVNINLMWAKPNEGKVYHSDDTDIYAVDVSGNVEGFTLGGHGMWQSSNGYPIRSSVATAESDLYWVGGYADGKYAGFEFTADFIYDWGKVKSHNNINNAGIDDVKYSGWLAAVSADFPWENWDFGGGVWYGSGANADKHDKRGDFVTPVGSEPGPDAFTKYSSIFWGSGLFRGEYGFGANGGGTQSQNNYIGGTWGGFLYAGYKVNPWYKVYAHGMYLADTTKNGDTAGNSLNVDGTREDNNAIGFEFTLSNIFKVYNNLDLYVVGGWLFAGDALKMSTGTPGDNKDMKDPYVLATRLVYTY
jgi:hypothetical protein